MIYSIISHGPLANQTRYFHSELVSELNTSPTSRTKPIQRNDPSIDIGHFDCRCRVVFDCLIWLFLETDPANHHRAYAGTATASMPGFCRTASRVSPLSYQGTLYSISRVRVHSADSYGAASHWGPFLLGADGAFQVQTEQDFLWGPRDGHWPVSWLLEMNLRFYSWSTASLTHAPAALRRTPEGSMMESANPEASG